MDKYSGCNIVDSVVSSAPKSKKVRAGKPLTGFVIRVVIAAVAIGLMCAIKYAPVAWATSVKSVLHSVFCYDVFGRDSFGAMPIIAQIFGA